MQALVDGVVLAVHGKNRDAVPACRRGDQRTRHDQHFFVGQRNRLARVDRREHRLESGGPGRGADHDVDRRMRGHGDQAFGSTRHHRAHIGSARGAKTIDALAGRHRHHVGPISCDLLGQKRCVVARGQRDDAQARGMRVHDGQRAPADRSGRAENGQSLHVRFRT